MRISEGREADGNGAATFGLDALMATESADLAPVVVATAVSGVIDLPDDLSTACVRMLRRLEPKDLSIHLELNAALARLRKGDLLSTEAADQLSFLMDLPHETPDESTHPATPLFWPGASLIYRERLPDQIFLTRLDEHLLREALLEMDADLTPAILAAADNHGPAQSGNNRSVDFAVVRDAAIARGLTTAISLQPPESQPVAPNSKPFIDLHAHPSEALVALDRALFSRDQVAAFHSLAKFPGSFLCDFDVHLIAEEGAEIHDGTTRRFSRDRRALSGYWLAKVFFRQPQSISALLVKLLDSRSHVADRLLQHCPGLLFGVLQGAFLLNLKEALTLWAAANQNWQDYLLVPDRRIWYFDLVFEAPDGQEVNQLRKLALDAADSEDRLLDVCLSARRWHREPWLEAQVTDDLASGAPWRTARALILQGMMGREPDGPANPAIAPLWLEWVKVAAFRYARREARMVAWIHHVAQSNSRECAVHATRVLEADADRRFHGLLEDAGCLFPDRCELLNRVSQTLARRDSHGTGMGLLQNFLGIPNHPWLGPPGLPNSAFLG